MNLSAVKQQLFSYIVGEIYEAAHNPPNWQTVLDLVCRLTKSNSATLMFLDQDIGKACMKFSTGLSKQILWEYNEHWCSKDPSYDLHKRLVPVGVARACHQLVPNREELESMSPEFYRWLKQCDRYYIAGATLFSEDKLHAAISVQRSEEMGEWSDQRMDMLTALVPHIQRALKIHRQLALLETEEKALRLGFDKMVMGLALIDRFGEIVYTNPMANNILQGHPSLTRRGNRIYATHREDGHKLAEMLNEAIQSDAGLDREPRAIGLRSPASSQVLPVLVTPVSKGDRLADADSNRVRAAIYFSDPQHSHPMSPDTLMKTYGLTAAEAWVAIGVANGLSLEDVAEQSGTSINTARSQLRSIFRKTNTSRQAELVKLLLTGPFSIAS